MNDVYDFVVIGGGSAGYAAAAMAVKLGLKTAVVEGGTEVGGLCILRGCMPSKTFIESANRFLTIQRAAEFGLRAEKNSVHGDEILARKTRLVAEFADYRRGQLEAGKFKFMRGWARFTGAHELEIVSSENERTRIESKTFLLATGSVLKIIPVPGLEETGYRDSDAVLDWGEIPKSVAILGAGATGLEFAHFYAGLGTQVTVLQRGSQVLKEMDADVAAELATALEKRGIKIFFKTILQEIERAGEMKRIRFEHEQEVKTIEVSEIIYALGRTPQLHGLELQSAGVTTQSGRLAVNSRQQTNTEHIFAAGDVAGPFEIVHLAVQQGELAARNAAKFIAGDAALEEIDYRLKLFVVFTHPEVAAVGMTEKELQSARVNYRVAQYPYNDHGKALVLGEPEGFVKLIAEEKSGEILGAAVVGARASELIHEIAVAMHFQATAADLATVPHYHPTLSEIWTYPAEELAQF